MKAPAVDVAVLNLAGLPLSRLEQLTRQLCDGLGRLVETTVETSWAKVERFTVHLYDVDPARVEAEALLWFAAHGLDYRVTTKGAYRNAPAEWEDEA